MQQMSHNWIDEKRDICMKSFVNIILFCSFESIYYDNFPVDTKSLSIKPWCYAYDVVTI